MGKADGFKHYEGFSPYLHWFAKRESGKSDAVDANDLSRGFVNWEFQLKNAFSRNVDLFSKPPFTRFNSSARHNKGTNTATKTTVDHAEVLATFPLPAHSRNPIAKFKFENPFFSSNDKRVNELAKILDDDAVITAIIDTGIAIGHERFRCGKTGSRVLASWQQSASFTGQNHLPFGRDIHKSEIETLLSSCLTEDDFNLKAGISQPLQDHGARDVDFGFAHGTHVADLAAGQNPEDDSGALTKRPIIAVNLPARFSHGSAGNFLEYYALFAFRYVVELANALSDAKELSGEDRLPLVINMSFGMQAGAKDGSSLFETAVNADIAPLDCRGPVRLVMPVGNDNLSRGSARSLLGNTTAQDEFGYVSDALELDWLVPPGDATANFLEIWTATTQNAPDKLCFSITDPLTGAQHTFQAFDDSDDECSAGQDSFQQVKIIEGGYCHIYRQIEFDKKDLNGPRRYRVVVALMPTEFWSNTGAQPQLAPAGRWKIKVECEGDPVDVTVHVQSDQAVRGTSGSTMARSYLDHENYDTHVVEPPMQLKGGTQIVPIGMPKDSFYVSPVDGQTVYLDSWGAEGPIQRKGSHNAIATGLETSVIGAYRVADKTPSSYSATVYANVPASSRTADANEVLTGLFPGDDGAAHPGLLAAGSKSGSTALLRGTSASSALATRFIVDAMLQTNDKTKRRQIGRPNWLKANVEKSKISPLRVGAGFACPESYLETHLRRVLPSPESK
mgnify:FL=1